MTTENSRADALTDLLPCPFCNGTSEFDSDDSGYHWVACRSCGVSSDTARHYDDDCRERLAAAWNTRAASPVEQPAAAPIATHIVETEWPVKQAGIPHPSDKPTIVTCACGYSIESSCNVLDPTCRRNTAPSPADECLHPSWTSIGPDCERCDVCGAVGSERRYLKVDPVSDDAMAISDAMRIDEDGSIREVCAPSPADERAAFSQWARSKRIADSEFHFSIWQARAASANETGAEGVIQCQAHSGPDCAECGGTGVWPAQADAREGLALCASERCDLRTAIDAAENLNLFDAARAERLREVIFAAHPGQPERQPHQWDKYGERCELCGDKDWMPDSACHGRKPGPRAEVTFDDWFEAELSADRMYGSDEEVARVAWNAARTGASS